jgi:hypothetical protein
MPASRQVLRAWWIDRRPGQTGGGFPASASGTLPGTVADETISEIYEELPS